MREDAAGALVDHLERTDHADRLAVPTVRRRERHPVDRERWDRIDDEGAVRAPRLDPLRRVLVPVGIVVGSGHVDQHDVARVPLGEAGDVGGGEHVVGRRGDVVEREVGGVARRAERFEAGHRDRLPPVVPA